MLLLNLSIMRIKQISKAPGLARSTGSITSATLVAEDEVAVAISRLLVAGGHLGDRHQGAFAAPVRTPGWRAAWRRSA